MSNATKQQLVIFDLKKQGWKEGWVIWNGDEDRDFYLWRNGQLRNAAHGIDRASVGRSEELKYEELKYTVEQSTYCRTKEEAVGICMRYQYPYRIEE